MTRRLLAMLLAVVMVISVLPVGVFAEGSGTPDPQAEQTTAEKHTKYSVLASHDHVENDAHICEHCVAAGAADTTPTWIAWGDDAAEKTQLPRVSGHYYITGDLSKMTSTNLSDVSDRDIVICLNGKTLSCNNAYNTSNRFYTMGSNNKVTILDCTAHVDGEGNYVAGTLKDATYCTIFFKYEKGNATFTMYDGIMADSVQRAANGGAIKAGGAILIQGPSRVNLYGGEIRNATGAGGGAIRLYSKGAVLDIDGAAIRDCTSTGQGSAILASESTDKAGSNPTQITIKNAVITGNKNTALSGDACGGAVFVNSNTAVVTLGGNNQITGNTDKDGAEYNLFLQNIAGNQPKYTISGLATTARMGVRVAADRAAAADGLILTKALGGANVAANFVSDDTSLKAEVKDDVVVLADAPLTHEGKTHICEHCLKEGKTGAEATPTWTAWGDDATETNLPTAEGHYYLTRDMQVKKAEITDGHVVLCLNGKTVTANGAANSADDRFYYLRNAGSISIVDCTAHTETGGGQEVYKAGKLTGATAAVIMAHEATTGRSTGSVNIYDGIITGNYRSSSGGTLAIQGNCKLNIYGGEFSNNRTDNNGAVINTIRSTNTVYIENAVFKNNTAKLHGAVLVGTGCDVTIKDTVMTGNVGGGVGVIKTSGTTVLENVTITGNRTATGTDDKGAVWHNSTTKTFTLKGNTQITGNTYSDENATALWNLNVATADHKIAIDALAATARIGVTAVKDAPFTDALTDADALKGNFLPDDDTLEVSVQDSKLVLTEKTVNPPQPPVSGHDHKICGDSACTEHAQLTFQPWPDSLPVSGNYYLTKDVVLTQTLNVTGTNELNLCLNGYSIYCKDGATFRHFSVGDTGKLSITDCAATPGSLSNGGSGAILSTDTTQTGAQVNLYRISLKNNTRTTGGTIIAQGRAVFNLHDVEISGSNATSSSGVVYMQNYAQVNITGGSIHDNRSAGNGGVFNLTTAFNVLNVKGTEIKNNTTDTKGGVIYTEKACTVSFEDCVITGNHADNSEGGVAYLKTANSTFKNCQITGNSANNGSTLVVFGGTCLLDGTKIQNNHAKSGYGAVHINRSGDVNVTVQGETVITGNTTGTANKIQNVYMRNSQYYLTVGALTGNAQVGITMETARLNAGLLTISANDVTEAQTQFLTSDNDAYAVGIVDNKAALVSGHGHKICTDDTCADHSKLNFAKWEKADSLPTSGSYYLTQDVTLSANVAMTGTTLNLCLNGYNIYVKEGVTARHFYLGEGATLNITDCSGTPGALQKGTTASIMTNKDAANMAVNLFNIGLKNNSRAGSGGVIAAQGQAVFNLTNVEIANNEAAGNGGVVYAQNTAEINITGGSIHDNQAVELGGAFYLTSASNKLSVKGTEIYNNTIVEGENKKGNGAVLYTEKACTVTFEDCVIRENKAEQGEGAIYLKTANSTFKNCQIKDNLSQNGAALVVFGGTCLLDGTKIQNNHDVGGYGAIHLNRSGNVQLIVQGETVITGNTYGANNTERNLYMRQSTNPLFITVGDLTGDAKVGITMEAARLSANNLNISENDVTEAQAAYLSSDNAAYSVKVVDGKARLTTGHEHKACLDSACTEHADIAWAAWTKTDSLPASGNYYLAVDVQLTGVRSVSGKLNLCLNGHTVTAAKDMRIFSAEKNGVLSITDCTGNGMLTGGSKTYGGAIAVQQGGTLNLFGGKISGNTALTEEGGAVYIKGGNDTTTTGGIFNMYGGEISGNTARQGTAIRLTNATGNGTKAQFNMYGGKITGNTANTNGSAIYAGVSIVNIMGGEISGNTAGASGTIYVGADAELTISGGKITGNVAGNGAGVYVVSEKAIVTLTGDAYVLGNTAGGKANNLFLDGKAIVTLGELSKDAKVGVGAAIGDRAISTENETDYIANFQSDSVYKKLVYKDKALYLVASTEHSHCVCAAGAQGCDHTAQNWQAWESSAALPTSEGYFYLTEDVVLSAQANFSSKTYLCLNGHSVTMKEGATNVRIIKLQQGAELSLTDCQGTGKLSGGNASWGAGVNINRGATFNMYGGIFTGNTSMDEGGGQGAAVYVQATKEGVPGGIFNMYGGTITENEAVWGGAVYGATKSTINIYGGKILKNNTTKYGGGIYSTGADTTITGGTFESNTSGSGGAIYVTGANTKLHVENATFTNNTVSGYAGGAILAQSNGTEIFLKNSTFTGSHATAGGAVYASTNTKLTVEKCTFSGNTADMGASIYTLRCDAKITGTTMEKNTAEKQAAGIYISAGTCELTDVTIKNNKGGSGVAMMINSAKATIDGKSTVLYPTVTLVSGTISGNTTKEGSGGAVLMQGKSTFNMKSGSITGNSAKWCGGVYASTNSTFNMYGGYIGYNTTAQSGAGVYGLRCTVNLYGGTIANNTAEKNGGGVYISGAKLYLTGTQIIGNVAKTGTGGGGIGTGSQRVNNVLYEPYIKMTGGCISDNKGRHGGGVLLQGSSKTYFDFIGGKITGNEATEQAGGAIYASTKTTVNMSGGEISGNTAEKQGGAVYHNNSFGNYENGVIYGNTAKSSGGALLVTGANTVVTVKNVKLYDHKGASGGTICDQGKAHLTLENVEIYNSEATNSGGAIYVSNNTYLDMINVNIHDSFANLNGGAICLGNNVYVTADGLTIENNETAKEGGAIYSRSMHVLVKNAKISGNVSAGNGGAVTTYKPAMQGVSNNGDYRTGYIFENTEFSNNTSKGQGGALYVDRGSKMTLINVQMTGNTSALEGSASWTEGDFVVDGLTATGNTSKSGGYAVHLADSKYDGHSYFTGTNQLGGDVIVNGNEGGDMYMGENTTAAMLESGFGEKTNFNVTLHSGLLTNKLYGEYNYEGSDLNYTVTYGSRSLTEPEYAEPVQETEPDVQTQPGTEATEPAQAGEDNTMLYAGIGGIAGVVVLAAVILVIVKKKKAGNTTGAGKE